MSSPPANRPAKLDAALNAPELDIDAALGFGNALLAGSDIERPHDMTIAADIGRATIAGIVGAQCQRAAEGRRRRIADRPAVGRRSRRRRLFGERPHRHRGAVAAGQHARRSRCAGYDAGHGAAGALCAGNRAGARPRRAGDGAGQAARAIDHRWRRAGDDQAKLAIDGSLGKVRVALNGQANADPIALSVGDMRLDGKLEADDGKALVAMLGLDRVVAVDAGPGALTVNASGPARGELRIDGRLTAGGLEADVNGTARLFADNPSAALRATIVRADVAPLRGPAAAQRRAAGRLRWTHRRLPATNLSLADINANIGGTSLRGKLGVHAAAALSPARRHRGRHHRWRRG